MRGARAAVSAVVVGAVTLTTGAAAAQAAGETGRRHSAAQGQPFSFAVIGDVPYGAAQVRTFPTLVDQVNADPDVRLVAHLGDIKSGSSPCTDAYLTGVRQAFDRFEDPLVYTPGDNEWTDCHRPAAGGYDPLERLDVLRSTFFDQPGRTLGLDAERVASQASQGFPENVAFRRHRVSFAAVHVVGSNNAMAPWTGRTQPTPEQSAEVAARTAAAVELVRATFAEARRRHDRSVVLLTQADMFDPTVADPAYADYSAFAPLVRAIASAAAAFDGPVHLLNGDSHVYRSDAPLATGSPWLDFYDVPAAGNLRRVTVEGSATAAEWLRVTVDPREPGVLRWTRVPWTS